ncbi:hypothetical protein PG994_004393 [Apiospora phragmitis]|uniref:Uncharacterized protein n=1 Tax=Apiospora phragmitis TaxID=2905665 RepID=A0ABR1VQG8_9PEZI
MRRVCWPQECTARAFAWLDHCIEHKVDFEETVVENLNANTNKKVFTAWPLVREHMCNYAQKQIDLARGGVRSKRAQYKEKMARLLAGGSSIVPNLTGDTEMADLVADIKASLAESNVGGAAEVKKENEVGGAAKDVAMNDNDEKDVQLSSDDSSQSEYMGSSPVKSKPKKSGAAGPSTVRTYSKKRQQSSAAQLPPPKRSRPLTQSPPRDLSTDEDELSVIEVASNESFIRRAPRRIIPAKAPRPRKAPAQGIEQQQERPHFAPPSIAPPEPYHGPHTPASPEKKKPSAVPPLAFTQTVPRQIHFQVLEQQERAPSSHPRMTIPETPNAQQDWGCRKGSTQASAEMAPGTQLGQWQTHGPSGQEQASSEMAAGTQLGQSQTHGISGQEQSALARENTQLWKMFTEEKNEKIAQQKMNTMLRNIISSPPNHDHLADVRHLQLHDRFKTRANMNENLRKAKEQLPNLSNGDLAGRFKDLQLAIRDASWLYSLTNLDQTLAVFPDNTMRDKKIKLLVKNVFGSGANAWELDQDEESDVFRALITAHVFFFVFESSFPSNYTGHDESAILTEYRKVCFERDGAEVLFVTDRVALQSYLEDSALWDLDEKKPFQNLVRIKAQELAREAAELLAPLSAPANLVADSFTPVYVAALRLKADMVLSNKTFTARFIRPGGPVDPDIMEVDNNFGHQGNARNVKQCLFPIVYSKPIPEIDAVHTELSQCLVDYTNFAVVELQFFRPGETVLYKGLVIASGRDCALQGGLVIA